MTPVAVHIYAINVMHGTADVELVHRLPPASTVHKHSLLSTLKLAARTGANAAHIFLADAPWRRVPDAHHGCAPAMFAFTRKHITQEMEIA